MIPMIGEYALAAALLCAVAVVFAVLFYWQQQDTRALGVIKWGTVAIAGLLTLSSATLVMVLVGDDFSVRYAAEHSNRALSLGYKLTAFWASQGGGMLFWAWAMALMAVVMVLRTWKRFDLEAGVGLAVMAAIVAFFAAVILFAGSNDSPSNPFELLPMIPKDGLGLNVKLQNVAMAVHPPMLFLGYAGYAAPFALLMGALIAGKGDGRWIKDARLWAVWAWVTLTVGIVLGCWWAYVDLSFGGYWKWDPVENASLVPWLAGTAFLHSAVVSAKRGMLKGWTAALTVLSFVMCLFGTYITRSGIQSSHSFAASDIPNFFLGAMAVVIGGSVVLLIVRRRFLRSEHPLEDLVSREGFILSANVLLVAMTLVTAAGTAAPLIVQLMGKEQGMVEPPFYNMTVLPMALLLAGLMSTGPVLGFGTGAADRARKQLAVLLIAGVAVAGVTWALGFDSVWAIGSAAVVGAVLAGITMDVIAAVGARREAGGENLAASLVRVFTANPRHWGAQIAHFGLATTIVGIVGSSVYSTRGELESVAMGESRRVGDITLTYSRLERYSAKTYNASQLVLDVKTDAGETFVLRPEVRKYDAQGNQATAPVDLRVRLGRDVYSAAMVDARKDLNNTTHVGLLVVLNPLVNYIWIGGTLLTLAGLVCLIPARKALVAAETKPQNDPRSKSPQGKRSKNERI